MAAGNWTLTIEAASAPIFQIIDASIEITEASFEGTNASSAITIKSASVDEDENLSVVLKQGGLTEPCKLAVGARVEISIEGPVKALLKGRYIETAEGDDESDATFSDAGSVESAEDMSDDEKMDDVEDLPIEKELADIKEDFRVTRLEAAYKLVEADMAVKGLTDFDVAGEQPEIVALKGHYPDKAIDFPITEDDGSDTSSDADMDSEEDDDDAASDDTSNVLGPDTEEDEDEDEDADLLAELAALKEGTETARLAEAYRLVREDKQTLATTVVA